MSTVCEYGLRMRRFKRRHLAYMPPCSISLQGAHCHERICWEDLLRSFAIPCADCLKRSALAGSFVPQLVFDQRSQTLVKPTSHYKFPMECANVVWYNSCYRSGPIQLHAEVQRQQHSHNTPYPRLHVHASDTTFCKA